MNDKEAEIVSLKKRAVQDVDNDALVTENSDLRVGTYPRTNRERKLEDQRRENKVIESGYKAVKQYLEDGSGFRGSKELQSENERVGKTGSVEA